VIRRRAFGLRPRLLAALVFTSIVTLAVAVAWPARAEDMPLSAELQVPLFLKILTYDRRFESRFGSELKLGVVYAPLDPQSVKAANDVTDILYKYAGKTVKRLPVSKVLVEFSTPENLERSITTGSVDVLYVAPGNAKNIAAIIKVSRARQVTLTRLPGCSTGRSRAPAAPRTRPR
jgi:hypothetical protein